MPKYAANTVWLLLIDKTSFSSQTLFFFSPFLPIAISANPMGGEQPYGNRNKFLRHLPFLHSLKFIFLCAGGHVVVWTVAGFSLANAESPFHTFREPILRDRGPSGGFQASQGNHNPLIRVHRMPQFTWGHLLVHRRCIKSVHYGLVNCRFNWITLP